MKKMYLFVSVALAFYPSSSFSMDSIPQEVLSRVLQAPQKYYERLLYNFYFMPVCKQWRNYIVEQMGEKKIQKAKLQHKLACALFDAVIDEASNDEITDLIKHLGADMHYATSYFPNYPIISCWRFVIQKKDLRILQCFITNEANLNAQDDDPEYVGIPREPGLFLAVTIKWIEGIQLLLQSGADPNIKHQNATAASTTNDPQIKGLFNSTEYNNG